MTDVRDQGLQVFRELLPGVLPDGEVPVPAPGFGGELFALALDNVFGRLWTRDGLSRRERSLVTLGALIALRAEGELGAHVRIARNNGLTEAEIAEVIYHCTAYAGFPAANAAMEVAKQVLGPGDENA
ncbi:carboxymuconolactone decarboxylase family protein [Mycolicibacterium phlei]